MVLRNDAVVVTSTFYNLSDEVSRVRAALAEDNIRKILDRGYPVIAVDGGSPKELIANLERYGSVVYPENERGMGKARRQVIRAAYERDPKAILWAEPEKDLGRFLDAIFEPLLKGRAEFVNVGVTDRSSRPLFQQQSEALGNIAWKNITGVGLDMFFGARAWLKDLSKYFFDYDGEKQDAIHIPVVDIVHGGHAVEEVRIDLPYPSEQKRVEEGIVNAPKMVIKRLEQLTDLSRQTLERWEYLQGKKT